MSPTVILRIVVALLAFGALWLVGNTLIGIGEGRERARWVEAQIKADREAEAREDEQTLDSEAIADTSRDLARDSAGRTTTETDESVARIEYVYLQQPAPKCTADGAPRPIPDVVLQELDSAVRATAAAAGRLPAGSAPRP